MKKILLVFLAMAMLVSCNSDDDNKPTQKFMTTAIIDGDPIVFQYDDNKNLKAMYSYGEPMYTFDYDNDNNLIAVSDEDDTDTPFITIQYQNGQIASITNSGMTIPVTYNEQTSKYVFGGVNIEAGLVGKDLGTIDEIGGDNILTMEYVSDHKGPFYNTPTKNSFLYALLVDLYYFTSTKPIAKVTDMGEVYTAENTYDDEGYVIKSVLTSGGDGGTIIFQYSEL